MTNTVDGINVAEFLRRGAIANYDKVVLSSDSQSLKGKDALRIVTNLSEILRQHGIDHRHHVLLISDDLLERALLFWAITTVGAYPLLAENRLTEIPAHADWVIGKRATTPNFPEAFSSEDLMAEALAQKDATNLSLLQSDTVGENDAVSYVIPSTQNCGIAYGARSHRNVVYTGLFGTFSVNSDRDQSIAIVGEIHPTTFEIALFSSLMSGAHIHHHRSLDWSKPLSSTPDTWIVSPEEIARLHSTHPRLLGHGDWIVPIPVHRAPTSQRLVDDLASIHSASPRIRPLLVDALNGIVAEYDFLKEEWTNFIGVDLTIATTGVAAQTSKTWQLLARSPQVSHQLESREQERGFFADGWARPGLSVVATATGFQIKDLVLPEAPIKDVSPQTAQWANGLDVVSLLQRSSRRHSGFPAVQVLDRSITHGDLHERVEALAKVLKHLRGIAEGDRVALLSRNTVEFAVLYLALNWLGAIFVPLNFRLKPGEVAYVLKDSGAKLLVYDEEFSDTVQTALTSLSERPDIALLDPVTTIHVNAANQRPLPNAEQVAPDENRSAAILYTAGTTGFPKGAVRSNRNVIWFSFLGLHSSLRTLRRPTHLITTPMFHIAGHEPSIIGSFATGGFTLILNEFNVDVVLAKITEYGVSSLFVPPTIGFNLLDQIDARKIATSLQTFRYWSSASAPLPSVLLERINKTLPWVQVANTLGMTETGSIARYIVRHGADKPAGCIGRPTPAAEVSIVDPSGKRLGPGQPGEIVVRSPQVISKYWNNTTASADALRDGWFHGGDIGEYDTDFDIEIKGRLKEMIITGGENVYAAEVENALLAFPEVKEAAVFGRPDPKWGESVNAAIVLRDGVSVSEAEIIQRCRDVVAHYKCPKRVAFLSALPRNPMGKVTKFAIEI